MNMNYQRTISQRLFNPESPDVECRMTMVLGDSFIYHTQFVLIHRGSGTKCVMFDYSKCEPFLLERRAIPYKIVAMVSWVNPGDIHTNSISGGTMFRQLTNLEFLEWKLEQKEKQTVYFG